MKSIIYFAFISLMSVNVFAQQMNQENIAEKTKVTATKISQELNFDDDKSYLLHRAIYSVELSRLRAEEQFSNDTEKLEATKQKINKTFPKILEVNFTEQEIANIQKSLKKLE